MIQGNENRSRSGDLQEEARQLQNKELAACGGLFLEAPPVNKGKKNSSQSRDSFGHSPFSLRSPGAPVARYPGDA